MLTWIKIAVRNLAKQKRRSTFTILAIAMGFAGVTIFGGFTRYMFDGLRDGYIYGQGNGHLAVFKKGFREKGSLDPARYLLTEADIRAVREICRSTARFQSRHDPAIPIVAAQLHFTGLIGNGDVSTIFVGVGRVPSDSVAMMKRAASWEQVRGRVNEVLHGQPLQDNKMYGIMISSGLARKLNVDTNANVVVTGPTVDGQMNALNAQILCRADTADEMLSDKLVLANLTFAQSLYNTKGADILGILLAGNDDIEGAKQELERLFTDRGLDLSVCTWKEMSPSYTKVADMFNVIFSFLFVIVFVIVVLSVVNTISMAVLERTREIGTLRALGLKRRGIVIMFATESAVLAFFGSAGGLILYLLTVGLVRFFEPKWVPPIMSRPVPLQVYVVPEYIAMALFSLMILAVAAAVWPTRRATRMSIIDALGHV